MMKIHEAVSIAMGIKGYNKKALAGKIKMSPSALTDFLNGRTTKLDITKAQDIANVLGCTLDFLVGGDIINIDVSEALKDEREEQRITTQELSAETHIPELWILKFESGDEKIGTFLFEKICDALGMNTLDFLHKYDLYDGYIPPEFNGDVNAYEAFKKALLEDQARASAKYPELKDIVEKGMYTVAGQRARRSFKRTLDMACQQIYLDPLSVFTPSDSIPGDDIAALNEVLELMHNIANNEQLEELNSQLEMLGDAAEPWDKFLVAVRHYHQVRAQLMISSDPKE